MTHGYEPSTSGVSFSSIWQETLKSLFTYGGVQESRVGNRTIECVGYRTWVEDTSNVFLRNERRKLSASYAWAEFLWYLSLTKSIHMIRFYAPQYELFSDDGGETANGAYGYRMSLAGESPALVMIRDILQEVDHSRQAVVGLWDPNVDLATARAGISRDVPCTISWQFLLRNDYLHMITTMRSNDAWLGLPYDVFVNTRIMRMMAHELGVKPGFYEHNVGSMHLYEKHWKAAQEALKVPAQGLDYQNFDEPFKFDDVKTAIHSERRIRSGLPRIRVDHGGLEPALDALEAYCDRSRRNRLGRKDDAS